HTSLQAGLLRGSVAAAPPGVEGRGARRCADSGGVSEAGAFPGEAWAGPACAGAEGNQGPSLPNSQPPPEVYVSLIEACGGPGNFSPSFSELQRNFVKHRPTKLKSLLRLVKHWYQQAHHPGSGRPHPQRSRRVQMGHRRSEGLPVPETGLLL
ncbi:OASL isoform 4, partial [Pongo abelii]